jgi:hypothetical protein
MLSILAWVEATPVAVFVRESLWAFPILVAIHIMGLILSVGMVIWFDLRLLGVNMCRVPVSITYRRIMPWAAGGFLVMVASGGLLWSGSATSAYANPYFRAKLAALLLASINAGVYHGHVERSINQWDTAVRTPTPARMAGLLSIALWSVVIVAGRLVAYTLYSR